MQRRNEQKTMEVKEETMLNETGGREGNESEGEGKGEQVRRQKRTKRKKKKGKRKVALYCFHLLPCFLLCHPTFLIFAHACEPWYSCAFSRFAPLIYGTMMSFLSLRHLDTHRLREVISQ